METLYPGVSEDTSVQAKKDQYQYVLRRFRPKSFRLLGNKIDDISSELFHNVGIFLNKILVEELHSVVLEIKLFEKFDSVFDSFD